MSSICISMRCYGFLEQQFKVAELLFSVDDLIVRLWSLLLRL